MITQEQLTPAGKVAQVTTFDGREAAEAWRRSAGFRNSYMAPTTQLLLATARVSEGAQVLVVGAGTGGEALDAAKLVGPTGHVAATDLSPAMIAAAKAAAADAGLENMTFAAMDAQHLEFPDASFDAVTSRNVLMFIPDLAIGLGEMRRVLRPAGRIGATVWSRAAQNPRISGPLLAARALGANPSDPPTYRIALRLSSRAFLRRTFRTAGFRHIDLARVALSAHYASLDEAVAAAMEQPPTRELLALLGDQADVRMRRSLKRRWARFGDGSGADLPGEQLVVGATR